jgi:hypothetical protein
MNEVFKWFLQIRNAQSCVVFQRSQTTNCHSPLCNLQWDGKVIPLQALTGPEGSRRLRLPDFKTIGIWRRQDCQSYAPSAFIHRNYSWYSFLLEAESTPGPECGRKGYINDKFNYTIGNRSRDLPVGSAVPQPLRHHVPPRAPQPAVELILT